jgi:hypothetical protein
LILWARHCRESSGPCGAAFGPFASCFLHHPKLLNRF